MSQDVTTFNQYSSTFTIENKEGYNIQSVSITDTNNNPLNWQNLSLVEVDVSNDDHTYSLTGTPLQDSPREIYINVYPSGQPVIIQYFYFNINDLNPLLNDNITTFNNTYRFNADATLSKMFSLEDGGVLDLNGNHLTIDGSGTLNIAQGGKIISNGGTIINNGSILDKNHELLLEQMIATTSTGNLLGDPYIRSANGKVTKTPDKHGYYRLFENNDIYINVEVDELDISKELNKFLSDNNFKPDESMGKLIDKGYWNKSVYIESEGHSISYNLFKNKLIDHNDSEGYFTIINNKKSKHNKCKDILVDDIIEETINILET